MTDSSHLPRPSLVFPAKLPDLTQADYDRYKFKQARLDRHMTQEQFGAALGITSSLVTKIERGERNVSDQVMHDLRKLPEAASGAGEREADQTKADYCPGYCARGEPHNGPHDPVVLHRQSGGQTAEVFTASLPPATDPAMVLMPARATREMIDAADACADAYEAYGKMVEVGRVR
jgi:transcriptional regulator with XRE-family HTH domain